MVHQQTKAGNDIRLTTSSQRRLHEESVAINPQKGIASSARYYYYLPIAFSKIAFFALNRRTHSLADLRVLSFLLITPLLYVLGFRGSLKTPFGKAIIMNRDKIRSVTHGAFKTHFGYLKDIESITKARFFPVVVDIGANVGDFSLALAPRSGKVIALEPGSENFNSLRFNIEANGVRNVVALNIAAHHQTELLGLAGIGSMLHIVSPGKGETATGLPLDEVLENLRVDHVDLLKLDVQGHEEKVLLGMVESLTLKRIGLLVVEAHPIWGIWPKNLVSIMTDYGYHLVMENSHLFGQPHL